MFAHCSHGFGLRRRAAAIPVKLVFTTQPVGAASGSALATQPVVKVETAGGTVVTGYTGTVHFAINAVSGSPVLTGTVDVALVNGVATATDLGTTGGASTWTLTATLSPLTSATSSQGTTTASGVTAFDKGFNFRNTAGFVADGANETYVLPSDAYTGSVIRNGVAFGWTTSVVNQQGRDRSAAVDRRLAGLGFNDSLAGGCVFRIDLPEAGTYDVRIGVGDVSNSQTGTLTIKDGATVKIALSGVAIPSARAMDATGTVYTDAAWPGSNTAVSVTMAGTVLTLELPQFRCISHLFLSRTA